MAASNVYLIEQVDWPTALVSQANWLRSVLFARLRAHEDVEDVLQEVHLSVLKSQCRPRTPESVMPWLYRVAVRQALIFRRKMGRRRRAYQNFQSNLTESTNASPLDWILANERNRNVLSCVTQMPPRDAEILMLKYGHDWSYNEIARHLGVSESAVESRLHRARAQLRERLTRIDHDA